MFGVCFGTQESGAVDGEVLIDADCGDVIPGRDNEGLSGDVGETGPTPGDFGGDRVGSGGGNSGGTAGSVPGDLKGSANAGERGLTGGAGGSTALTSEDRPGALLSTELSFSLCLSFSSPAETDAEEPGLISR